MGLRLVDNATRFWKWASVQIAFLGGAVQFAAYSFHDFKDWLGDNLTHLAGALMFAGVIAGRMVKKDTTSPDS